MFGEQPISLRRFTVLVNGLPPNSALHRSLDPQRAGRGWLVEHELLATLIEVVDTGNLMFLQANVKRGTKLPSPTRVPRPADLDKQMDKEARRDALKAKMADRGIPIRRQRRKAK